MTDAIGTVTMYPKLERREWIFGTLPDPRDARIAELEAALREIESEALRSTGTKWGKLAIIQDIASGALMPPPESDMTMAVEEWDA